MLKKKSKYAIYYSFVYKFFYCFPKYDFIYVFIDFTYINSVMHLFV